MKFNLYFNTHQYHFAQNQMIHIDFIHFYYFYFTVILILAITKFL